MSQRKSKEATLSYSEKLRDPRWQKMRLTIMERDKFKCRQCHNKERTLNVHLSRAAQDLIQKSQEAEG